MNIDFDTLTSLTTSESAVKGAVTQITNAEGNIIWQAPWLGGTFKVEKITSNVYVGNETYEGEKFILLDIYPKSGGTVTIDYEGVTKTITDDGTSQTPAAQQVFFGTPNNKLYKLEEDEKETPDNGIVTITGEYSGVGCGTYKTAKYSTTYANCITALGKLTNIAIIPAGAFLNCASINRRFKIPNGVTKIGNCAFEGCTTLPSIAIPSTVTNIVFPSTILTAGGFVGCSALKNINVDENNEYYKSIDGNLYSKDKKTLLAYAPGKQNKLFAIPDSVTSIRDGAFNSCDSLTSVEIPYSVTSIGDGTFYKCTSLTSIEIPYSVTSIGQGAFWDCSSLTSIEIPNSVTSIGYQAFSGTGYYNNEANWENGVLYIGKYHLIDAKTELSGDYSIKEDIRTLADYAFEYCTSLTSITIPDSVTSIGKAVFYDCSSLTSVTIGENSLLTSIGERAFYSCDSLTSVEIPYSVTSIGKGAFQGCTSLASITIPDSVTSIGDLAFASCTGLNKIVLPSTPPILEDKSVFNVGPTVREFYVPSAESLSLYQADPIWSSLTGVFVLSTPFNITFNANGGTGSMPTQEICGYQTINKNTFTAATVDYRFIGWNTKADGTGAAYSNEQVVILYSDITLYAQWSNSYTITYKHTNKSTITYGSGDTGHQECYELRINGEPQDDMGVFSNEPRLLPCSYGDIVEIACTWYLGETSASTDIYHYSSSISDNSSTRPSGYYPYSSSNSLTYNSVSEVAYLKFKIVDDVTIDFLAKTNAPALWNKEAYWDCDITGNIEII